MAQRSMVGVVFPIVRQCALVGERIEPQRYYELIEKDMCKFGYSTRDYVLMNERSLTNAEKEDEGHSE